MNLVPCCRILYRLAKSRRFLSKIVAPMRSPQQLQKVSRLHANGILTLGFHAHEVVVDLVNGGASVDARNNFALVTMVSWDRIETARFLIQKGADVRAQDGAAMKIAIDRGNGEIVSMLILFGAERSADFLCRAIASGNERIVKLLLDAKYPVKPSGDQDPLLVAIESGQTNIISNLLAKGAVVDTRDHLAFRTSSKLGQNDVLTLLLAHGADMNAKNGQSLVWAAENNRASTCAFLLGQGIRFELGQDDSALFGAVRNGHVETVKTLLLYYSSAITVPAQDILAAKNIALQKAASRGFIQLVDILVASGADAHHEDELPLMLAAKAGKSEMVAHLIDEFQADMFAESGAFSLSKKTLWKEKYY
jgi:ankyrin repeat protein